MTSELRALIVESLVLDGFEPRHVDTFRRELEGALSELAADHRLSDAHTFGAPLSAVTLPNPISDRAAAYLFAATLFAAPDKRGPV